MDENPLVGLTPSNANGRDILMDSTVMKQSPSPVDWKQLQSKVVINTEAVKQRMKW